MPSKKDLKPHKELIKDIQIHQPAEVTTPPSFPFGSVSCRREYEEIFGQLFSALPKSKDNLK